ncbi:MAG: hypothetical protein KF723_03290 [Rhizobiaceae bacterium]|nr:hypothetical protein [Rhizobiaceae bacterium]
MRTIDILDTIAEHGGVNRGAAVWDWASFETPEGAQACFRELKEGGAWMGDGVYSADPESRNEDFRKPHFMWRRD